MRLFLIPTTFLQTPTLNKGVSSGAVKKKVGPLFLWWILHPPFSGELSWSHNNYSISRVIACKMRRNSAFRDKLVKKCTSPFSFFSLLSVFMPFPSHPFPSFSLSTEGRTNEATITFLLNFKVFKLFIADSFSFFYFILFLVSICFHRVFSVTSLLPLPLIFRSSCA